MLKHNLKWEFNLYRVDQNAYPVDHSSHWEGVTVGGEQASGSSINSYSPRFKALGLLHEGSVFLGDQI